MEVLVLFYNKHLPSTLLTLTNKNKKNGTIFAGTGKFSNFPKNIFVTGTANIELQRIEQKPESLMGHLCSSRKRLVVP